MGYEDKPAERGTLRSVGEVLGSAMPHRLALHIKISEIKERWAEVVGRALASRSSPLMFEYGDDGEAALVISAASPAAGQRAQMSGDGISRRLDDLWRIKITGVRVKVR